MSIKTVNLEDGRPTCDAAIRRLTYELSAARAARTGCLKLIHGYGSSGAGGRIRTECRAYLERQQRAGKIKFYVTGEQFTIFSDLTRHALDRFPELRADRDLERYNNGITFVVLL